MSKSSVVIGIILAIIGCILQAIGFIIQKVAHNDLEKINKGLPDNEKLPYITSKVWILGFFVNAILGTLFNLVALKVST